MATLRMTPKLFGISSIIGGLFFLMVGALDIFYAMQTSWDMNVNSLSDLSVIGIDPSIMDELLIPGTVPTDYNSDAGFATRVLMCFICAAGGVMISIMGFVKVMIDTKIGKMVGAALILDGVLLALIGSYNKMFISVHFNVAVAFALVCVLCIAVTVLQDYKDKSWVACIYGLLFFASCGTLWILHFLKITTFGFCETFTYVMICFWVVAQGAKYVIYKDCIDPLSLEIVKA